MTMTATNSLPAIIELPADALLISRVPKAERTLNRIKGVISDQRRANHRNATERFTARWNERVDAALVMQIDTIEQAEAMMRLALAVQGETPDHLFRTAMEGVAGVLAATVAAGAQ